jgi:hypothetical protein
MGYWKGRGSRGLGVELLLEESEKVVVWDLGQTRGGTGEIPEGRCGVIHGLVRVGRKEKDGWGRERYKEEEEGERAVREWVLVETIKGAV